MKSAKFFDRKYSDRVLRRDYSKTKNALEMPNLLEMQKNSFQKFLDVELESVIKNIFPIESPNGKYTLNFSGIELGSPRTTDEKCRYESNTFDAPLYVNLELVNNLTGEVETSISKKTKKNKEGINGIFFGNIPLMSEKGTFVINGIEKFVIAQIIRSPGMYVLNKSQIKLNNSRKKVIEGGVCEILPYKGTLMIVNVPEGKDHILINLRSVNGDQAPAVMATTILKAYGFSNDDIKEIYGHENKNIRETLLSEPYNERDILSLNDIKAIIEEIENEKSSLSNEEIIKKGAPIDRRLRQLLLKWIDLESTDNDDEKKAILGKIITEKAAKDICLDLAIPFKSLESNVHEENYCYQALFLNYLFYERYYDLSPAGRYKINRKLRLSERLYKKILAEDLFDNDNNVVLKKGTLLSKDEIDKIKEYSKNNNLSTRHKIKVTNNFEHFGDKNPDYISKEVSFERLSVFNDDTESKVIEIVGSSESDFRPLVISDLIATISYAYNLVDDIGSFDDIDHLGNKRLKLIHELLKNKLATSMVRIEKSIREKLAIADGISDSKYVDNSANDPTLANDISRKTTIKSIVNTKPFQIILKDFFNSYQLIQFIDQQNPLSELTNKRRISAMGPGGISREDPNLDIRDVHNSHYGRICPIETPEGMNIGLIMSLASYAKADENGFIKTPYRVVKNSVITDEIEWLTPLQDDDYIISDSNVKTDENNKILNETIVGRYRGTTQLFKPDEVDYIDVIPKQVVSVAASLIPFLENDDANRALMGANMQRQAVPLINPKAPWVGTGSEYKIGSDSGTAVVSKEDGVVSYVDGSKIIIKDDENKEHEYKLIKYRKSNQNTCNNQTPIVFMDQKVQKGTILANGPAMENGELSLGRNVLVGFTTWSGYNFEDAIILSERLVNEDVYTSVHIDEYKIQCLHTKNGDEEITREVPNVSENSKKFLDSNGIITIGAEVKEGDILVGKVTPRGQVDLPPEEKLLFTIFGEKTKSLKDSSLKVPHGGEGIVIDVKHFKNSDEKGSELGDDVIEVIKVYIAQKRKIQVGDKMAGRHGNKGIVSKIVPVADMPFLDDGTPLDVMLNPLGVPSRMNIGQILELHLGYCTLQLGKKELLRAVYEKQPVINIQERYGFSSSVAEALYKNINNLIASKQASNFEELFIKTTNNDLLIALNKLGLNFDDIGYKVSTPVFEGVKNDDLIDAMNEAGLDHEETKGKFNLRDGRTGDYLDGKVAVGVMYMLKLDHMVDDKIHARSVGPYSKITQQPLGGKSQNGGQRFGEMEVWALEAYGAAYNLHEILTIKSDDARGRNLTYNAIINNKDIPFGGTPESFKLLTKQLQGLVLSLDVETHDNKKFDINEFIGHEYSYLDENQSTSEEFEKTSVISRDDVNDEDFEF